VCVGDDDGRSGAGRASLRFGHLQHRVSDHYSQFRMHTGSIFIELLGSQICWGENEKNHIFSENNLTKKVLEKI
jgi:hypothetical protein